MKRILSILLVIAVLCSTTITTFAKPVIVDSKYTTTGVTWVPNDGPTEPTEVGGIHYQKIVYLSRENALAIYSGMADSELIKELKAIRSKGESIGVGAASYYAGNALVSWATKQGLKKLASFAGGVGGGIMLGEMMNMYLDLLKDVDKSNLNTAISQTKSGYFVKVSCGYFRTLVGTGGYYSYITTNVRYFESWNLNTVKGIVNVKGSFNNSQTIGTVW